MKSAENQRTRTVKRNVWGSLIIKGISIAAQLVLVPLTLGYVSTELYGVWLTLSSIMLWLNFFDVGFTLGLKNRLAEAIALKDWERGQHLVSTTYFMMVLIFLPLCVLLSVLIPHIQWTTLLNVNRAYEQSIQQALYILSCCFCLQMIVNVLTAVIAAFQKVALSASFPVIGNILSVFIIWILTKHTSPSLAYLSLAISLTPIVVVCFASLCFYNGKLKKVAPSIKKIKLKYAKDLFRLGYKFFLIQVQVVVLYQTTNILISNVSGPEEVTYYNIAYKYLGVAMMIFNIILNPLWPAFTDAYVKKDYEWMNRIYKKMSVVYFASVSIMVLMVFLSSFAYGLWIGSNISIPLTMTFIVFLYMTIHSWDSMQVNMINGIGTIKLQTFTVIIGLVVHVPLSLFLGRYFGAYGVLSSMILINIIYASVFTTQIRKILLKKATGIWIQ